MCWPKATKTDGESYVTFVCRRGPTVADKERRHVVSNRSSVFKYWSSPRKWLTSKHSLYEYAKYNWYARHYWIALNLSYQNCFSYSTLGVHKLLHITGMWMPQDCTGTCMPRDGTDFGTFFIVSTRVHNVLAVLFQANITARSRADPLANGLAYWV